MRRAARTRRSSRRRSSSTLDRSTRRRPAYRARRRELRGRQPRERRPRPVPPADPLRGCGFGLARRARSDRLSAADRHARARARGLRRRRAGSAAAARPRRISCGSRRLLLIELGRLDEAAATADTLAARFHDRRRRARLLRAVADALRAQGRGDRERRSPLRGSDREVPEEPGGDRDARPPREDPPDGRARLAGAGMERRRDDRGPFRSSVRPSP